MNIIPIPNGWYGFCNPDGQYRSVIRDVGVKTNDSLIPIQSVGNNCLFLQLSPDGTEFSGKSHLNDKFLSYENGAWNWTNIPTWGNSPVIYDNDNVLSIISAPPGVGASGYGYCDFETNELVSADKAHELVIDGKIVLYDYTYLGDGLYVGQTANIENVHEGKTAVYDKTAKKLLLLSDKPSRFIEARRRNNDVGIYFWCVDGSPANAITATMAELRALPLYNETPVPVDNFGPISAPSPSGTLIHINPFGSNWPRTGTHPMNMVNGAYVKFGNSDLYELWKEQDGILHHLEDKSGPLSKRFTDTRWFPLDMKVGLEHAFNPGAYEEVWADASDCREVNRVGFDSQYWILNHYNQFDCGPDLGVDEVCIGVYDPTNGVHTEGRYIELYYFSKKFGWLRWESYASWIAYETGVPIFDDNSRAARSDFYRLGGPNTQPNLTGCALQPVPPVPPNTLKKPEVTVENWLPELKDGWEFKFIDRENPGFGARVWTENGSFYASFTNPVGSGRTGATRLYKKCNEVPPPIPPIPTPIPPGTIQKISISGLTFRDEQNNIFPYRGFSSFLLLKRFLNGEDINSYLKAWSEIGYNVARIFSQVDWTGSPGVGFTPNQYPNYNAQLGNFLALCSQHGLYVELVAHTFNYDLDQMASHVERLVQIGKNHKNFFLELANEPPVNGIDIQGLVDKLDTSSWNFIWSSGSYDSGVPRQPSAPIGKYVTCHLDRGNEWPRKFRQLLEYRDGGIFTPEDEGSFTPVVHDEPIGGAEFNQPGRRSNVSSDFYSHGAGCQLHGAGGTYHHESGLNSIMPIGLEWDCAKAFIAGLRLVPTGFQLGNYCRARNPNEPDDNGAGNCPVETDVSLRTYGMIAGNLACCVRVRATGPYTVRAGWTVTSEDSNKVVITLVRT